MKKILFTILACLAFLSNVTYAKEPSVFDFVISLKNDSANDCVLKKQQIIYGRLTKGTVVPEVLFRGQTMSFMMRKHGYYKEKSDYTTGNLFDAQILLTYECGDNETITLMSHRIMKEAGADRRIRGVILDQNHLDATFTTSKPSVFTQSPSKIDWVITNAKDGTL
ncbi:MAG TPA: hypothetical protein VHD33_05425 [Legionellaceae bacterium]|nr:hypothetical protein [Legionellaceae bacterium]